MHTIAKSSAHHPPFQTNRSNRAFLDGKNKLLRDKQAELKTASDRISDLEARLAKKTLLVEELLERATRLEHGADLGVTNGGGLGGGGAGGGGGGGGKGDRPISSASAVPQAARLAGNTYTGLGGYSSPAPPTKSTQLLRSPTPNSASAQANVTNSLNATASQSPTSATSPRIRSERAGPSPSKQPMVGVMCVMCNV